MTRIRTIVLALLAVFCLSAVAAAVASANEGEFVNKNGAALTKNKFVGTSGVTKLVTVGGATITCKKDSAEGLVLSKTTNEATVDFKECENQVGSACKGGTGAKAKEIIIIATLFTVRNLSTGRLFLVFSILGIRYKGGEFEIECGTVKVKVKGNFIVPVGESQEKTLKTLFSLTAKQKEGKQEPIEYENEKGEKIRETLEAKIGAEAKYEQAAEEGTEDLTFEEAGEFK